VEKVLLKESWGKTTDTVLWHGRWDLSSILQCRWRRRESALGCGTGYTKQVCAKITFFVTSDIICGLPNLKFLQLLTFVTVLLILYWILPGILTYTLLYTLAILTQIPKGFSTKPKRHSTWNYGPILNSSICMDENGWKLLHILTSRFWGKV